MWSKFGEAKLLCTYIGLTKFEENPEGSSFFCVDLTWNDPYATLQAWVVLACLIGSLAYNSVHFALSKVYFYRAWSVYIHVVETI